MNLKRKCEVVEVIYPGEALKRFDNWVGSLNMKAAQKARVTYEQARETLLIKDALKEVYKTFGVESV